MSTQNEKSGEKMASFTGLVEMVLDKLLDKLRVNVVIVAVLVTILTASFGSDLISHLDKTTDSENTTGILGILIGTGIGGLIAAMIRMFESPSVPADVHERMIKALGEKLYNQGG